MEVRLSMKQQSILADKDFCKTMDTDVLPFLEQIGFQGYLSLKDGACKQRPLSACKDRYLTRPNCLYYEAYLPKRPIGAVVISHGFSESIEKYKEVIFYFAASGYQVYLADHPGHGRSLRYTDHPCMVHIDHFESYTRALHDFVTKVVIPSAGSLPLFLYGHSMGGCIAASYLETYPKVFRSAVLSSPMLGINMGPFPEPCAHALGFLMTKTGNGSRYAPGQKAFCKGERFEDSCSSCFERFHYYHEKRERIPLLQTSGSSYAWAYESLCACRKILKKGNCEKITVPLLVFRSASDSLVKPSAISRFVSKVPSARLITISGSRHEIYNSPSCVLEPYYREIFTFLGNIKD